MPRAKKVIAEPVPDTPKPARKRPGPKPKGPPKKRPPNAGMVLESNITPVQEAYCRARASGMSQVESLAAIGSPFAVSTVVKWEKDKRINGRIQELSALATKNAILKTGLSREWVIDRLMTVVDRCMQAEPVIVRGEPTGEYQFDSAGANQALKMLGDTMGMFKHVPKAEDEELEELPDDALESLVLQIGSELELLPAPKVEDA